MAKKGVPNFTLPGKSQPLNQQQQGPTDFQGLSNRLRGQNSPSMAPAAPGAPQPPTNPMGGMPGPTMMPPTAEPPPILGVSGVTPGAIERRLGMPPTLQVNTPQPPSQVFQHQLSGVQPGQVNSPLQSLLQLLQQRMGQGG